MWDIRGPKEIKAYFDKVVSIVPPDLKFVVEDITDGDPRKVGVAWYAPQQFTDSLQKGEDFCFILFLDTRIACCSATPRGPQVYNDVVL